MIRPVVGRTRVPLSQVGTDTPLLMEHSPVETSLPGRSVAWRRDEGGQLGRGGCSPFGSQGSATAHGHHATPDQPRSPTACPCPDTYLEIPPVSVSPPKVANARTAADCVQFRGDEPGGDRLPGTTVAVTFTLAKSLGDAGYGRIEFAFNVVIWLVLIVRDTFEGIVVRELARHPRLIRPVVNHVLAVKGLFALSLFVCLIAIGNLTLSSATDRTVLMLYGLLLITTALGLDFVYRGTERMGLVAVSLCIRTLVYAVGVWSFVADARRIAWVPAWLALGEACGIGLVWFCYVPVWDAPPDPGAAISQGVSPPGPFGLLDPGGADGDRVGRRDHGRLAEPVGRHRQLRADASDDHGGS